MKAEKIVALIDSIRPNTADAETKLSWIENLEKKISEHMTRYGEASIKAIEVNMEYETLLGDEYAYMYAYFGVAMLDLGNQDISMYNNSSAYFNDMFENWQKKWRREHLPKEPKRGDA